MTNIGKAIFGLLVAVLIISGIFVVAHKPASTNTQTAQAPTDTPPPPISDLQKELATALPAPAKLPAAQPYQMKDKTLEIELSEWVGYSGLIAYNGGLAPNPDSPFTKATGYQLKLTVSEDESWDRLVSGKLAASSTTADVLAVYGKQLNVVVPVQIDFSRGADAIVVRNEVTKINDLQGKIVSCCQFTESDFLLRDLAREAGLSINILPDLSTAPDPDKINVVVTDEGGKAGDVFIHDIKGGFNKLSGCVTWSPKTEEVVAGSDGKAHVLTTNRNLLIVADILLVNRPFAQQYPEAVQALTKAVIDGNALVNSNPHQYAGIVEKAFKWKSGQFADEVKKVHLSNLPENLAFFNGSIDSAGSFGGIYQMAALSYGQGVIHEDTDSHYFAEDKYLKALDATGDYKDQQIAIAPIKIGSGGQSLETNPLLSKNIRFYFEPNSTALEQRPENAQNFEEIKKLLQVSPGSTIVLRGHVDDAQVETFRAKGGDGFVQQMALKAIQLSKDRAESVRKALVESGVSADRISSVGKGWEEPIAQAITKDNPALGIKKDTDDVRRSKSEKNRRVEAVWLTIE